MNAMRSYGNGLLYGESDTSAAIGEHGAFVWSVLVDWDGDGVYDADEVEYLQSVRIERGREGLLDEPMVGRAEIVLINPDRRFDSWYEGSPLGKTIVGRRVNIRVGFRTTNTLLPYQTIFVGQIEDIEYESLRPQNSLPRVRLIVHDGWQRLHDQNINVELKENLPTRDILLAILAAAGWHEQGTWKLDYSQLGINSKLGGGVSAEVDFGNDNGKVIPYWWAHNESAARALLDVVSADASRVHISRDGRLVWRTIGDDCRDNDLRQLDDVCSELQIRFPQEDVANRVVVEVHPRQLSANIETIWQNINVFEIQPNETKIIFAEFNDNGEPVPAKDVVNPVAGTDYVANERADGTGEDRTNIITVAVTVYGMGADVCVENVGNVPAYVTLLQLRGRIVRAGEPQSCIAEDAYSIALFGRRSHNVSLRWLQNSLIAQDYADFLTDFLHLFQPNIRVRYENRFDVLAYDLGDKFADTTSRGVGGTFRVGKIEIESPEESNGQTIFTTLTLYHHPPDNFWILDRGKLGAATKLAY